MKVKKATAGIGAYVDNVDLRTELCDDTVAEIRQAWLDHQVLFFRDQSMSLDQQKDFGRRFGELFVHPTLKGAEGHPEVLVVHADENSKVVAGQGFHSDVSCFEEPPSASILRIETVPSAGGDTLFASGYLAYDALSSHWQRFVGELHAVHSGAHRHGGKFGIVADHPESVHPVVRTHPETGRKLLYVNGGFTTHIVDMSAAESTATLRFLFDHIEQPEFQCRFAWEPESIAMWDNRCVQHHAVFDYHPEVRHGYRVTVVGDRPS